MPSPSNIARDEEDQQNEGMQCNCPRCKFDRENGGISMDNEIGAIKSLLVPGPDEQARAEVNANLNRPPLRNACTDLEIDLEREQRLSLLEAREAIGHQILDAFDAPKFDRATGWKLNVNGRLTDFIEQLIAERESMLVTSQEWEALYSIAIGQVLELREELRQRDEDARSWARVAQNMQEEINFLTSGLQNYASHAWNDIKRELKERGWL